MWDAQVDETVFYIFKPLQPLQPDPIVEIENNDDDSDIRNIVSIIFIADPQVKDDPDNSEKEVDLFADRLESPTNESVYTVPESPKIL